MISTSVDRFKCEPTDRSMRLLKLHFTRPDAAPADDDVIIFSTIPSMPDLIRVTVQYAATGTAEHAGFSRSFVLTRAAAYDYTMTAVGSMIRDDDPYDKLQISSVMFPSVLYRVDSLDEWDVRTSIQDIVYSSFNTTVS